MKTTRAQSIRRLGPAVFAFAMALSGCTGVLNDPAIRSGSALTLLDDEPAKYLWREHTDINGNKKALTINGICGMSVTTVAVEVTAENGIAPIFPSTTATCEDNGDISFVFKDDRRFLINGRYKLRFLAQANDTAQTVTEVQRIYDFYWVANPSLMTELTCRNTTDAVDLTIVSDECTIEMGKAVSLTAACTTEATEHSTTVTIGENASAGACPTVSQSYPSLDPGPHLVPVSWIDPWGNNYARTILIKVLDEIDWWGGGVSFLAVNDLEPDSGPNTAVISMAIGTALTPIASEITHIPVPFARAPASGPSTATMSPGFLSLVYGLNADD